jgi:hypothetical protein
MRGAEALAYPSRLLSQERPKTSPRAKGAGGPDETVDWASVEQDLDVVRGTNVNVLVVGAETLVMTVIRRLIADAPASIVIPCEAGRLPLSRSSLPPGTLVLRDVDALDADGQALLLEWLGSASAERQIVSTASASLLPLVNAGRFDDGLYYRLNTIFIPLGQ